MRPSSRTLLAIVMLAVAVFGPLAVAFDACAAMCETPCALTVGAVFTAPVVVPPVPVSDAVIDGTASLPAAPDNVLKPPPKSALSL